ncbi:MAG: PEP/pyruvate-binding domain-containing protein [Desulfobacterales bacterium]
MDPTPAQTPSSRVTGGDARRGRLRSAWSRFLTLLEILGLRAERPVIDPAAQLARFKLYHAEFRKLITANNSFLETLAELNEKRSGAALIDHAYVIRKVVRAVADIHAMVESFHVVSGGRHPALRDHLGRISGELEALCRDAAGGPGPAELVLDLPSVRASHADLVGGKAAHLGELRNALGLPTPNGFAVTTEAFRLLLEEGGLRSWIQNQHMLLAAPEDIPAVSAELREGIRTVPLPPRLAQALREAYERLCSRMGCRPALAVRSSAVGEDGALSFAGQFTSVLNVPGDQLPSAYLEVVASLFSPEAMHYRLLHHLPGESAEMAVCVIAMEEAEASGVVFSRDPNAPDSGEVLIQAVHGLGVSLVDGRTSPEIVRIRPDADTPPVLRRTAGAQESRVVALEGTGIREETLDAEQAGRPCLSDEEALQLARWALLLERHFGCPQDVEFAVGAGRRLLVLQSRPLRVLHGAAAKDPPVAGAELLLAGGETACPGVGAGPAVHLEADGDLDSFPEGGVLVTRRSSPRFVRLMRRARAIVADAGSTTGHMASLARELKIPTLLNTKNATRAIPPGAIVTVDAGNGYVYAGEVAALLERCAAVQDGTSGGVGPRLAAELEFLDKVLAHMAPLHLTDPSAPSFSPDQCRTLHDLARFIHEKSYEVMFGLGEQLGDLRTASYRLDVFLPIDLYLIDLGGGFKETPRGRMVKPRQIASVPMAALLRGMLDRRIPRYGARPMDLGGLFSVMMRHATTSPEEQASFQAPCYALISDCYVNYSARVGYHFSVLDAYCSPAPNKNYINLLFRGGAADARRRERRTRAIANILRHHGFSTTLNADVVTGRLNKGSLQETAAQLEMIGRLLQFFRQMDAAMASDEHARRIESAFLAEDYGLKTLTGEKT